MPASSWNWLLIPFNPLPLVFWRWRRFWAWPFVVVLLAWESFMLLSPHRLTDPAYLVIVLAYVVFYVKPHLADGRPVYLIGLAFDDRFIRGLHIDHLTFRRIVMTLHMCDAIIEESECCKNTVYTLKDAA